VKSQSKAVLRGVGAVSIVVVAVTALTPAANIVGRRWALNSQPEPSGAIVVLGAGTMYGNILNQESLRRAIAGIDLYRQKLAPVIVLSGPHSNRGSGSSEAEARANLAIGMGVPPEAIIKEQTANTTREEAVHIAETLHKRSIHRILLVTDSLHMRRAKLVFERSGLEVSPAASADYTVAAVSPADRLWLAMRVAEESLALLYYRLARYI